MLAQYKDDSFQYEIKVSTEETEQNGERCVTLTAALTQPLMKKRSPVTGAWIREIDEPYHTVCEVVHSGGDVALFCAFSVQAYWVAIPGDIEPQEEINQIMASALRSMFNDQPNLASTFNIVFQAEWEKEKSRLEQCWAAGRELDITPEKLVLANHPDEGHQFAVLAPSTKQGMSEICGVVFSSETDTYVWRDDGLIQPENVTALTGENVARLHDLSAHEKLKVLSENGWVPDEPARDFEELRRPNGRVRPSRQSDSNNG